MNINEILKLLIENEKQSKKTINMVPSENYCSTVSRIPLLLDVYNRYFFNPNKDPKGWNFRGVQDVSQIETDVAIPLLKELSDAKYVSLRPISGLNCMNVVLVALGGGVGANILTVSPEQGGHFASRDMAESLGLNVDFLPGKDEHTFDFVLLKNQLIEKEYSLVYIDQSHGLFPLDVKELTKVVKEVSPNTHIHIDASHWLGFIFGNVIENPLKLGADSYGGTTHKTFPGPQRAVFCTNNKNILEKIEGSQYYIVSSHHFGEVVTLAITLLEFKQSGKEYVQNILKNTKLLAELLKNYGYDVKGEKYGFTAGHQIWLSTNNCGIDSYEASERLYHAGIRVNAYNELPGSPETIMRLGVNEITRCGARTEDMYELAEIIHHSIQNTVSCSELNDRVTKLRNKYPNAYGIETDSEVTQDCMELIYELLKGK